MPRKIVLLARALFLFGFGFGLGASRASADDSPAEPAAGSQPANNDGENIRIKTLLGSESPFSGQLNFTYSGSTLNHPFSNQEPNPGNAVPPPLASLAGTVSLVYRIDPKTTLNLGTGIITEQPFQGPKNTTLRNPVLDLVRAYSIGPVRNRGLAQVELFTDHQLHDQYGYDFALSAVDEAYGDLGMGFTLGLLAEIDWYSLNEAPSFPASQQLNYDIATDPFLEYRVSPRLTVRTLWAVVENQTRNLQGMFKYQHPKVYQQLGFGIGISKSVFFNPYVKFFPFDGAQFATSFFAFNLIVNLF